MATFTLKGRFAFDSRQNVDFFSKQNMVNDNAIMAASSDAPRDMLHRVSVLSDISTNRDSQQDTLTASEPGTPNQVPPEPTTRPDAHPLDEPVPPEGTFAVSESWLKKNLLSFGEHSIATAQASLG